MEEVQRAASNMIATIVSEVDKWDLLTVARKYVDIFWWRKNELALAARRQWRPSEEVLSLIRADAIPGASSKSLSVEKLRADFDFTQE